MRVEKVNSHSELYPALQKFISRHELLFNSPEWLRNYPERGIIQCAILNKNTEVIGCFSYFQFKKSVFKFIISPPYSPDIDLFYMNPAESVVGRNSFNKDVLEVVTDYFESLKVPISTLIFPQTLLILSRSSGKGTLLKPVILTSSIFHFQRKSYGTIFPPKKERA